MTDNLKSMNKKDKQFIGAVVAAGVGVVLLGITWAVEMAVHRLQTTMENNAQIQSKIKGIHSMHKQIQEKAFRKQGYKPLKELIKEDKKKLKKSKSNNKEVL